MEYDQPESGERTSGKRNRVEVERNEEGVILGHLPAMQNGVGIKEVTYLKYVHTRSKGKSFQLLKGQIGKLASILSQVQILGWTDLVGIRVFFLCQDLNLLRSILDCKYLTYLTSWPL